MTDLENHGPTNDDSSRTAVGSPSGERARRWMVHDGVELSVMSQQVRLHLDVYLESTLGKPWVNLKTEPVPASRWAERSGTFRAVVGCNWTRWTGSSEQGGLGQDADTMDSELEGGTVVERKQQQFAGWLVLEGS